MNKRIIKRLLSIVLIMLGFNFGLNAQNIPAFPGAEGHGKYVTGGRGGTVYYVTTLEDNGLPGSLRYAVTRRGARIVMFKVSGTIKLKSNLSISQPDITIAGQTAPGDGICLRDFSVNVSADNVIIRFMRFRMGDAAQNEGDALGGRFQKNIMIDHCSMSWSTDECVSFYVNENFTMQWCIISESLRESVHDKGAHGYGGIWGGRYASFHHNLLAHHSSRNPRLGETTDNFALTDAVDLRNNVIYNWGGNSCYGGEGMNVNIVNCYYKAGPATSKEERIVSIDYRKDEDNVLYQVWGKYYIDGNVLTESERATEDNWTYGVMNQFHSSYDGVPQSSKDTIRINMPHPTGEVTTHTAEEAYNYVLDYGGASLVRDAVDTRVVNDVRTGTAEYMNGGNGSSNGIIDTQSIFGEGDNAWPFLANKPAPDDTDADGMPDNWEDEKGLNKNDPADSKLTTLDGKYTNVEVYINSLVQHIINDQGATTAIHDLSQINKELNLYFNNQTEELAINHNNNLKEIAVYSVNGNLIEKVKTNHTQMTLRLASTISKGIYIVKAQDDKGRIFTGKFCK